MDSRVLRVAIPVGLATGVLVAYVIYERHVATAPLEWSGTVEARTIDVGSTVGGRVKAVLAREGDRVKAGQVLVELEPGDLQAQLAQAKGQLGQMAANLDKVMNRGVSARQQEIAAARARLLENEITLRKATTDLARTRRLVAAGASTSTDLENAETTELNARAQRDAQKATLDQLLRGTPQDIRAGEAQVEAAQGRLAQLQTQLAELTIRAPRDAEVETLDLRPGDLLAPDAVAAKLLEPDQLYVRMYVPETQLGYVHPGQVVPLYVDSFPGRAFRVVVEFVNSEGEYTPRNLQTFDERANQVFATRLRLENGADVLRAGMAAVVRVNR